MISALMFDRTIAVARFERTAAVVAATADDARVLFHFVADELMRALYVLSLANGETLLMLSGLLFLLAVVIMPRHSGRSARSSCGPTLGAPFEEGRNAASSVGSGAGSFRSKPRETRGSATDSSLNRVGFATRLRLLVTAPVSYRVQ